MLVTASNFIIVHGRLVFDVSYINESNQITGVTDYVILSNRNHYNADSRLVVIMFENDISWGGRNISFMIKNNFNVFGVWIYHKFYFAFSNMPLKITKKRRKYLFFGFSISCPLAFFDKKSDISKGFPFCLCSKKMQSNE